MLFEAFKTSEFLEKATVAWTSNPFNRIGSRVMDAFKNYVSFEKAGTTGTSKPCNQIHRLMDTIVLPSEDFKTSNPLEKAAATGTSKPSDQTNIWPMDSGSIAPETLQTIDLTAEVKKWFDQ